jgi:hypothetical protein
MVSRLQQIAPAELCRQCAKNVWKLIPAVALSLEAYVAEIYVTPNILPSLCASSIIPGEDRIQL